MRVAKAPFLVIVRKPAVVAVTETFLLSSGTNTFFVWRFGCLRILPIGVKTVARVRLAYPPPTEEVFLVIAHTFAIPV